MMQTSLRMGIAVAIALFGLGIERAAAASELNSPFTAVLPRLTSDTSFTCPDPPPAPVQSLSVTSIYKKGDPSHSEIDDSQYDEYSAGMEKVRDFLTSVTKFASDYVASDGARVQSGVCALTWIDAWARGNAIGRLETRQSALSATRIVAGLGIAYLAVRPLAHEMNFDTSTLMGWFAARAEDFIATYDESGNLTSNRSNHRYWGGFAVAAAGVITGDLDALKWGVQSFKIGACQVTTDGALPLELNRKKRARDYHLHAIAPLVMIAELAAANGLDAYGLCDGAIHRLVDFALTSVKSPARIVSLTGVAQQPIPEKNGQPRGDRFAWVEPYFKRFGGSESTYGFTLERPLYASTLGGRLTAYVEAGDK